MPAFDQLGKARGLIKLALAKGLGVQIQFLHKYSPTRKNLLLFSEQFQNAAWSNNIFVNVTPNTVANPIDGALTADAIMEQAFNSVHYCQQNVATNPGNYTVSIYAKSIGRRYLDFTSFSDAKAKFDLTNGVIALTSGADFISAAMSPVLNAAGWYRCSMSFNISDVIAGLQFGLNSSGTTFLGAYLGNGAFGIAFFGAQFEAGDLSPYMPSGATQGTIQPVTLNARVKKQRTRSVIDGNVETEIREIVFEIPVQPNFVIATNDVEPIIPGDRITYQSRNFYVTQDPPIEKDPTGNVYSVTAWESKRLASGI